MSLFQKSVEKKYLNDLDSILIDKKYTDFQEYFGNPERQENIRNSKEEQFQERFLRELFENKKSDAQILKSKIEKTDKEIDQMVYELYGLTEEEIKIVENV